MIMLLHSPSIQIYRGATVLQLYVISFLTLTFDLGKWKKSKWREKIRVSDILFIFLQRSIYELKNSEVQLNNINYEMTICLIK